MGELTAEIESLRDTVAHLGESFTNAVTAVGAGAEQKDDPGTLGLGCTWDAGLRGLDCAISSYAEPSSPPRP